MPRWAGWWEAQRHAEDVADLAAVPVVYGRGAQLIKKQGKTRSFTGCWCSGCGKPFVADAGRYHGSSRCTACTKRYWQGNHETRARRYGVTYELIVAVHVFEADNWTCCICGKRATKKPGHPLSATLDHIVPLSRGGTHTLDNVQTAHARCNFKKGAGAANDQLRLALR